MTTVTGSCLCGKLGVTAQLPTLWVAHCHCTLCQKNAGAAFVTWAGFKESETVIDDAAGTLRWFSATENAFRGFCAACGTTLFFKSARWPGELHIPVVNIHQPLDKEPQAHVFWSSRQPWLHLTDGLKKKD
jgi:hypothetical protein